MCCVAMFSAIGHARHIQLYSYIGYISGSIRYIRLCTSILLYSASFFIFAIFMYICYICYVQLSLLSVPYWLHGAIFHICAIFIYIRYIRAYLVYSLLQQFRYMHPRTVCAWFATWDYICCIRQCSLFSQHSAILGYVCLHPRLGPTFSPNGRAAQTALCAALCGAMCSFVRAILRPSTPWGRMASCPFDLCPRALIPLKIVIYRHATSCTLAYRPSRGVSCVTHMLFQSMQQTIQMLNIDLPCGQLC